MPNTASTPPTPPARKNLILDYILQIALCVLLGVLIWRAGAIERSMTRLSEIDNAIATAMTEQAKLNHNVSTMISEQREINQSIIMRGRQ